MKPVVDRLENDMDGKLEIIRVNIQDSVGRELARNFGFEYTPTFIFFDGNGNELWRQVGGLDTERVRSSLSSP